MTPEFAYFLKVNVAFILLYAFYRLFFYKDTFFKLRRAILLAFFGLSLIYPLFNIQEWVRQQEPMTEVIQIYSAMLPEVTITPPVVQETDWHNLIVSGAAWLYWGGVIGLFMRFFLQLGSILMLARSSRRTVIHGIPVHQLAKPAGPFSFFQLIFLHPDSHSEKEVDEILTHECTHVFQWHSIDVMLCELTCVLCWVNPFVWLLKREVRHNLEYLADDTVLESGYDSKSYQYHLLGLAHHTTKAAASLSNSFNMLHLRNRILMMNKKRSRGIGRTKYLVFIPVSASLLLLSNIDALARLTDELAEKGIAETLLPDAVLPATKAVKVKAQIVDSNYKPIIGVNIIIKGKPIGTISDLDGNFILNAQEDATLQISGLGYRTRELEVKAIKNNMKIQLLPTNAKSTVPEDQKDENEPIFTVVEDMPEFPGGMKNLLKYLQTELQYPEVAKENGIEGRVSCRFTIQKDGTITNVEVIRGVDPNLDQEAIRVLEVMPAWKPGRQRGRNVAVSYTVPVTFRLGKKKKSSVVVSSTQTWKQDTSGRIFTVVEQMPEYPGGMGQLLPFLAKSIKYPIIAQENGIQGRVSCSFVINPDGSISDAGVVRGIDPSLDAEAIRVLESMPNWKPGIQNNMAVAVRYTVPVTFRLQ